MIGDTDDTMASAIQHPEARNAAMKVLISEKEGWSDHVMRVIDLAEGGYTPRHTHDWPHINYIIEGEGQLHLDGADNPLKAGSYAFVPAGKLHQFTNTGTGKFSFICIVPKEGHIV